MLRNVAILNSAGLQTINTVTNWLDINVAHLITIKSN